MESGALLQYAGIGLAMGILSGLFGVGGGILIVPALVLLFSYEQHSAQSMSLAVMVLTATAGAVRYHMNKYPADPRVAAVLALASIVGAFFIGAPIAAQLPGKLMQKLFGGFMFLVSLRMMGVYAWIWAHVHPR
jgi:uncharacterized membrane protein YfcA